MQFPEIFFTKINYIIYYFFALSLLGIEGVQTHVKDVHDRYLCSHCTKHFTKSVNKTRHENCAHGNGKTFECPLCEMKTNLKQTLQRHIISVHKNIQFNPHSQREAMNLMTKVSSVFAPKVLPDFKCPQPECDFVGHR